MTQDASFADGQEKPVNLVARDDEDLKVLSALSQDAVFPITEMQWNANARRFGILINRFRWELPSSAASKPERVQSVLAVENVQKISSQGFQRSDSNVVLSVLSVSFEPLDETAGNLTILLAGDGAIRLSIEALECRLKDVTRPYSAPSGATPAHH
ncbi:MAG: DUF2948 family protein [Paracoccaceae bacterium]|jgi:hypothetical protein|nr:DUF2948 family protein [Paracoccaceae bacterium]